MTDTIPNKTVTSRRSVRLSGDQLVEGWEFFVSDSLFGENSEEGALAALKVIGRHKVADLRAQIRDLRAEVQAVRTMLDGRDPREVFQELMEQRNIARQRELAARKISEFHCGVARNADLEAVRLRGQVRRLEAELASVTAPPPGLLTRLVSCITGDKDA